MNIVREEMNPQMNQNFNYNSTYYNNNPTIKYRSNTYARVMYIYIYINSYIYK